MKSKNKNLDTLGYPNPVFKKFAFIHETRKMLNNSCNE